MTEVSDIRAALATRVETTGLRYHRGLDPGKIDPPAFLLRRVSTSYDSTMGRGSDDYTFTVTVLLAAADPRVSEDALDEYLASSGTKSIKAAVEAAALGSGVDFARVATADGDTIREYQGVRYLGADFTVEVTADG